LGQAAARIRIADAGPKGKGAFAAARLPPHTKVAAFTGRPRWIWDIPRSFWPHTFQVGYDLYVLPRRGSAAWSINHSCDPNCLVSGRSIYTRRPVERGEELTFDYSTDVDWPGFMMPCRCGSEICRRVIRAYRYLPDHLKSAYGSNTTSYIRAAYGSRPKSLRPRPPRR
jgi:uncharacterized protein